jgi:hypothetical protein
MKKYIASMFLMGMAFGAKAAVINNQGWVNVVDACKSSISTSSCTINEGGITLKLSCQSGGTSLFYNGNYGEYIACNNYGSLVVESNAPIKEVKTKYYNTFDNDSKLSYAKTSSDTVINLDVKNSFSFTMKYSSSDGYNGNLNSIHFSFGTQNGLTESLQAADGILFASYSNALTAANLFKGEIAKTHRGHMARFMTALSDGITLLDPANKDKVSIVDWRVQENARLIVVFGTIMNELLTDYDDVERLKTAINSLKSLVDQLRVSYGWERGLAGGVSKASSALLQVVRLEIQELASIKMAMGESNLTSYTTLLRTSGVLLSKVNGSKSGDMKAQREIYDFADAWNSADFQSELSKLMNAGPDFKNLVLPKLIMLLKSVESINDLADAGLNIPTGVSANTTAIKTLK